MVLLVLHGGSIANEYVKHIEIEEQLNKEIKKTLKKNKKLPTGVFSRITVFKNRM